MTRHRSDLFSLRCVLYECVTGVKPFPGRGWPQRGRGALVGGEKVGIHASPLVLRAPPSRRKDAGVVAGLAGLGAVVGGLVGGKKGAVAGTVVGGAAGVGVVKTDKGQEVALGERAQLSIALVEPVTVARPPDRTD